MQYLCGHFGLVFRRRSLINTSYIFALYHFRICWCSWRRGHPNFQIELDTNAVIMTGKKPEKTGHCSCNTDQQYVNPSFEQDTNIGPSYTSRRYSDNQAVEGVGAAPCNVVPDNGCCTIHNNLSSQRRGAHRWVDIQIFVRVKSDYGPIATVVLCGTYRGVGRYLSFVNNWLVAMDRSKCVL